MKIDGKPWRTIWLEADGWSVGVIDQTRLPHRFATQRLVSLADAADAIASMVIRGAPLIGATAAYGISLALREDASDDGLERAYARLLRHAADRDQPQMGARRDDGGGAQSSARRAGGGRLCARRRDRRAGRRHQPRDGPPWARADRGDRGRQESGRAGQRADPLQRRLARRRRCRHRARAGLYGARCGRARPRLGRRDPPAQPGRLAHRLGAQSPRRAASRHSRQHRRPPDAARPRRHGDRRRRPRHRQRRRLQQDRHLFEGARRARQRRAVLHRPAVADDRLHAARGPRHPDRGARRRRGRHHDGRDRRRPHRDRARRAERLAGCQLWIRCHAGAAGHRPDHRARRAGGDPRRAGAGVPGTRAGAPRSAAQ